TKTASSSPPAIVSSVRTPISCAVLAAFRSATAAPTAAPKRDCSVRPARKPARPRSSSHETHAQGLVGPPDLPQRGGAEGGPGNARGSRWGEGRAAKKPRTARSHPRRDRERRPLRTAGALRVAVRPHPLAVPASL